jgi:hypothetical protein
VLIVIESYVPIELFRSVVLIVEIDRVEAPFSKFVNAISPCRVLIAIESVFSIDVVVKGINIVLPIMDDTILVDVTILENVIVLNDKELPLKLEVSRFVPYIVEPIREEILPTALPMVIESVVN